MHHLLTLQLSAVRSRWENFQIFVGWERPLCNVWKLNRLCVLIYSQSYYCVTGSVISQGVVLIKCLQNTCSTCREKCITELCFYLSFLLDGTLGVKSLLGTGTRFECTLWAFKLLLEELSFKTLLYFLFFFSPLKWEGITDDLSHDSSNTQSFISRDLKIINFLFQAIT